MKNRHYTKQMADTNLIQQLKECGAIQFGKFILTSGAVSDYYVDIKKASTNPATLKNIAQSLREYTQGYDLLAGMELGAVPLIVALSLETTLPYVIVRKEKRAHGTGKQIEGEDVRNKKVLIIEDVTTSGGSVVKTVHILRDNGALVDQVISVVDRDSGAKEKMQTLGINLKSLINVTDILQNKGE